MWLHHYHYLYWKDRCMTEKTDDAISKSRRLFYDGLECASADPAIFPAAESYRQRPRESWEVVLKDHKYFPVKTTSC